MVQRQTGSEIFVSVLRAKLHEYGLFCENNKGLKGYDKITASKKLKEIKNYIAANRQNLNSWDEDGNTPLHICLKESTLSTYNAMVIAGFILDSGALGGSVAHMNSDGETPYGLCITALNEHRDDRVTYGMFKNLLIMLRSIPQETVTLRD